jgi:site-specific recombinase XerD
MLNLGADILTVSKMLGHKDIRTTMIYAKVLSANKVKAANLINIEI